MTENKRFEIVNKYNHNELVRDNENVIDGYVQIYGIESVVLRMNELARENEQLQNDYKTLQLQYDDLNEYLKEKQQEIEQLTSWCDVIEKDLGKCVDERIRLQKENEQLREEKICAETKLYKANEELLMQMDYDDLAKQNQDQEFEIINLKKENEQLKSELQSKQLGLSLFNSENTMLIEENDQLKQSVDLLEFEKIELQIKLQKIRDLAQEDGEIKQGVIEKVVMGYDDE